MVAIASLTFLVWLLMVCHANTQTESGSSEGVSTNLSQNCQVGISGCSSRRQPNVPISKGKISDSRIPKVANFESQAGAGEPLTLRATPNCSTWTSSIFIPRSLEMYSAPVTIAMSCKRALRRSPKPGALIAHTLMMPLNLLTTSVASASPASENSCLI